MNDERFEDLLQEMRDESVPRERLEATKERVWQQLQESGSLACDELRPAFADYAKGALSEARRLLIEDHLGRCVECRHALAEIKSDGKVVALPHGRAQGPSTWRRWAVAAGLVMAVLYLGRGAIDSALAPSGPNATVVSVSFHS